MKHFMRDICWIMNDISEIITKVMDIIYSLDISIKRERVSVFMFTKEKMLQSVICNQSRISDILLLSSFGNGDTRTKFCLSSIAVPQEAELYNVKICKGASL